MEYTIKYTNIKTNKDTYIYLKPMTEKEAIIFKSKQMDRKDRIVCIIPYGEYLKNNTPWNF